LQFFGAHALLTGAKAFAAFLAPLRKTRWFVYAKRPFAGPKTVLAYLSRYTHRVAISNRRLIALNERSVTFKVKDYRIEVCGSFYRYDRSCVSSYRPITQSGPHSGCACNDRLLRDDEYSNRAEHCGAVALWRCDDHRGLRCRRGWRQRHLAVPGRYPFKMIGTVAGPGGGVDKISASGPVYKLASVADFPGRYTQSTGKAGFSSSGSSDLWLENGSGVIIHLQGTSTGAMLTLGKDEIFIRMAQ